MSTYTPIATTVLTSTASSVTFSSIPQNYTDLRIVVSAKGNVSAGQFYMQFNNDTGTNYSRTMMWNNNSNYGSARDTNYTLLNIDYYGIISSDRFNTQIWDLMQYSNPNITKNCLFRNTNTQYGNDVVGGLWNNTNAITNIFIGSSVVLAVGSTFSLYGIQTGGGYANGGNIVTTDGTYWYHTFLSSGAFIPTKALTVDYLVVAGGGGGGMTRAGGGGSGGLRCTVTATGGGGSLESQLNLSANTQNIVTIGAGGGGGSGGSTGNVGTNGSNSVFASIVSIGGGGGGSANNNGVSPSGGGPAGVTINAGASGTTNQSFAGGNGHTVTTNSGGGGGGGAGAVGGVGSLNNGGSGGNGVTTSISGSSVTYAGGGGGGCDNYDQAANAGAGGTGGGGKGQAGNGTGAAAAVAGTTNTGGGGGGGGGKINVIDGVGSNGGSGIVIVRYAV